MVRIVSRDFFFFSSSLFSPPFSLVPVVLSKAKQLLEGTFFVLARSRKGRRQTYICNEIPPKKKRQWILSNRDK